TDRLEGLVERYERMVGGEGGGERGRGCEHHSLSVGLHARPTRVPSRLVWMLSSRALRRSSGEGGVRACCSSSESGVMSNPDRFIPMPSHSKVSSYVPFASRSRTVLPSMTLSNAARLNLLKP